MKRTVLILLLMTSLHGGAATPVDPVFFRDNTWKLHSNTGEPLVLIHGLGSDGMNSWSGLLPALKKKYSVLTVGLPGLGGTPPPDTVSPLHYAVYTDWLLRRYFPGQKATVVCHSYGGAVGLRLLGLFPEKIRRMVIINGAGALHPAAHLLWFAERYTVLQPGSESLAAKLLFHPPASAVGIALHTLQFNALLRTILPRGGSRLQALLSLQGYDLRHVISQQGIPPVTFILGKEDHLVPPRSGVYLHYLIPGSRIIFSPQTDHGPIRTDPAGFYPVLQQALNGAGSTAPPLPRPAARSRSLRWKNSSDRNLNGGSYGSVKLNGCLNATLRNLTIDRLTVENSSVKLENCRITSIKARNSTLQLTAGLVTRTLRLDKSLLDAAGTRFTMQNALLHGNGESKAVFSLCTLQSNGQQLLLHRALQPPEGEWPRK